jgi:hypothetical protein
VGFLMTIVSGSPPAWQLAAFFTLCGIGGVHFFSAASARLYREERRRKAPDG